MNFTDEQKADLAKPLNRAHVKPPAPGKHGDYIEGWRVIDEANRIFGFDGWTRETVEMVQTCCTENNGKFYVGYRAKVRIQAGGVIREGTGCGSGDGMKSLADAAESAIKEAETDAMKRALMTFGNPFGLALYDKTKANVADEPDASLELALDGIHACETQPALKAWWDRNKAGLTERNYDAISDAVEMRRKAIVAMHKVAA